MVNKILNQGQLENVLKELRKNNKNKIGLCHGVFDLIHLGHIRHFEEAKRNVDILIVSLTSDKFVNKGPGRPAFDQHQRAEALASLSKVDYIFLSNYTSAEKVLSLIKPNFYFKGPDYKKISNDITGKIKKEILILKKNKGKIFFTKSEKFSSSNLLRKYFGIISNKQSQIIDKISKNHNISDIKDIINKFSNIRPLVIGESIIDEYHYSETLGKSGKEPVLVIRDLIIEKYLGGAGAVCRHLSNFVKKGYFLSYLGKDSFNNKFIKKELPRNFTQSFVLRKDVPTIIKRRYIDHISKNKILGNYDLLDDSLNKKDNDRLNINFKKLVKKSDLIIVTDYGHGLINENFAKIISSQKKFVAVNVQINSSNLGYHSLKNYKNIDCIIINESELRYELRSKNKDIKNLMSELASKMKIKFLVVTRGSSGSMLLINKNKKFYSCDGLATKVVDKVGAGDAMLSLITLCLYKKLDSDLSLLIASLCAAQSVGVIGNKKSINKLQLLKDIEHLI